MDLTGYPIITVDRAPADKNPTLGEKTWDQNQFRGIGNGAYQNGWCGSLATWAIGNDALRVCAATPQWEYLYTRSYATYRLMPCQPTIALARSIVKAPIIASEWSLDIRPGTPTGQVDFATKYLLPLRKQIVGPSLSGLDYGHAKFEIIWEVIEGMLIPVRFKWLAVDQNDILIDKHGNFAGIRPYDAGADRSRDLGPEKSWLYTYDGEFGDLVGRSRLENIRRGPWSDWWDTIHKMRKLREKLSGILPIIYHPPGTFKDKDGNEITFQSQALKALKNLSAGMGITLENLGLATDDIKLLSNLTKTSLTNVEFYDAGPAATGQDGFRAMLEYDDRQMMRGYLRPERVAMEGQHGTKAESQVQGEASIYDAEVLDDSICDQFNTRPLDLAMVLQFGEAARGAIKMKPSPLVDRKIAAYRVVMESLLKIPELAAVIAKEIDLKQIFDFFDIKTAEDFTARMKELQITPPTKPAGPNGAPQPTGQPSAELPIIRHLVGNLLQDGANNAG